MKANGYRIFKDGDKYFVQVLIIHPIEVKVMSQNGKKCIRKTLDYTTSWSNLVFPKFIKGRVKGSVKSGLITFSPNRWNMGQITHFKTRTAAQKMVDAIYEKEDYSNSIESLFDSDSNWAL